MNLKIYSPPGGGGDKCMQFIMDSPLKKTSHQQVAVGQRTGTLQLVPGFNGNLRGHLCAGILSEAAMEHGRT